MHTGQQIMVVDDHREVRHMLRAWLESRGYGVVEAGGGAEAIELVHAEPPELILMDIRMPGVDGREATKIIRQDFDSEVLPIIAISADGVAAEILKAQAAGCDEYLTKPVDLAKLQEMIDRFLPRR